MTFFIITFVLMMNFVWRYIDELTGKGLGMDIIIELLFYATINLIPLGMPLAMLLAAIMTMGNLGENYELLAMKSAGMSLLKIVRINGQRNDVAVRDRLFSIGSLRAVVEGAININALVTVLKKSVTKDVGGIIMLVLPDKRNDLAIAFLEGIVTDRPAIGTTKIVLRRPTMKIVFHCYPPDNVGGRRPR